MAEENTSEHLNQIPEAPEDKKIAARNINRMSSKDFGKYVSMITNDIENVEKSLMYFDFIKTNAAEMTKYLVILNNLHKCGQMLTDVNAKLQSGDIVITD